MAILSPRTAPGHARELEEFRRVLAMLGIAVLAFGLVMAAMALKFEEARSLGTGLVLMAGSVIFLTTRAFVWRLPSSVTVSIAVCTVLGQAMSVALIERSYPVLTVVPLIAIGLALLYSRGWTVTGTMVAALVVTLVIVIQGESSSELSTLPADFRQIFSAAGPIGVVGIFLMQLTLYTRRLSGAVALATQAERSRRTSDTRYAVLVNRLTGAVYESTFGPGMRTTYVTAQIEDLLGYTAEEWVAGDGLWASNTEPEDLARVLADEPVALRESDTCTWEYRMRHRDGRQIWIRDDEAVVTRDEHGLPLTVQGYMIDITEQKTLEAQLAHQAFHDALTGLPNRAMFAEQVEGAIGRARRASKDLALVCVDLDDFKVVNDTLGHGAGDRLLVEVGQRLRSTLRIGDTAARVGGDEFNVLLEGFDDVAIAGDVVRRLLRLLSEPYRIDDLDLRITATAGITTMHGGYASADDLQRQADAALYEAKLDGKARLAWYDPSMSERAWARLDIEHSLRRAIDEGELVVAYQPVFDLHTSRIGGVEALVRWRHPERGIIPPADFIPVAERSGLIVPLGRYVLREACRAAVRMARPQGAPMGARASTGPLPISVNVSALQILDDDFVGDVAEALRSSRLPASCLTLELTESVMILEGERTDGVMAALCDLGVRLAIDDFGTGYSSLSYARRFPVDELKVDRSFVTGLNESTDDGAIVTAAIAFARALHLDVIAEGVETIEQLNRLRAMGCDRIQGFLIARPLFEPALRAFLDHDLPEDLLAPARVRLRAAG